MARDSELLDDVFHSSIRQSCKVTTAINQITWKTRPCAFEYGRECWNYYCNVFVLACSISHKNELITRVLGVAGSPPVLASTFWMGATCG
jgi:hypothetical protein